MEWEHRMGSRSRVAAELSRNGEGPRRTGPRKETEKTRRDRRAGCRVGGGLHCGQIQLLGEEDGLLFSPERWAEFLKQKNSKKVYSALPCLLY